MTIYPNRTTAPIGELTTRRAERPASEEPRRSRAAAPPSDVARAARAEKVAAQEAETAQAEEAAPVAEFPRQELAIRKDDEINRVVVQVLDSETGEVVRQIPSEEWVRHLRRLRGAKGLFVDRKG